jgi:hypothetical protein
MLDLIVKNDNSLCLKQFINVFVTLMVAAVCTPETSVYYNETTQCSIPEGSTLQVIKPFYCLALQK